MLLNQRLKKELSPTGRQNQQDEENEVGGVKIGEEGLKNHLKNGSGQTRSMIRFDDRFRLIG